MSKTPPHRRPALVHSAFYRFCPVADPHAAAQGVRSLARGLGLSGSIVLAGEGINGTVAGPLDAVDAFERRLPRAAMWADGPPGMAFKRSECTTPPFGRLKVSVKPEVVSLGLPAAAPPPDEHDDSHLTPAAWRALMGREDVVLLDNRNHFEVRLGRFRGALDPRVNHFRDFVAFVERHAPAWRSAGRPVAMYCTGGIRCDKAAPWMRSLGLTVWQLQGGVLHHFQTLADADRDWEGECFVFDKRIALDTRLRETRTTADQVYDASHPDEAWRLQRARRLNGPGD